MLKKITSLCLLLSFLTITSCGGGKENKNSETTSTESSVTKKEKEKLEKEIAREKALLEDAKILAELQAKLDKIKKENRTDEEKKQDKFKDDFSNAKDVIKFSTDTAVSLADAIAKLGTAFGNKSNQGNNNFGFGTQQKSLSTKESILSKAQELVKELHTNEDSFDTISYYGELKSDIAYRLISAGYFDYNKSKDFALRAANLSSLRSLKNLAESNDVIFELNKQNSFSNEKIVLFITFIK